MGPVYNSVIPDKSNAERHVDLLVQFHNLAVDEPEQSITRRRLLTKQNRDRIYRFFEKYIPEVFTVVVEQPDTLQEVGFLVKHATSKIPVKRESALAYLVEAHFKTSREKCIFPSIYDYRILSESENEWIDSKDCRNLLKDKRITQQIVDIFLNAELLAEDYIEWLKNLAKHQKEEKFLWLPVRAPIIKEDGIRYYKLNKPMILEEVVYEAKQWHGLDELMVLEDAILVGIIEILNHRIEIKRCVNDWCERIFRVPGKGGYQKVYCGRSCQVKAYQERKNKGMSIKQATPDDLT